MTHAQIQIEAWCIMLYFSSYWLFGNRSL